MHGCQPLGADGSVNTSLDPLSGEFGKTALDLIDP